MKTSLLIVLFTAFLANKPLLGQDMNGDGFITVLVPISAPQPVSGANGTIWKSELWVHNDWDHAIALRCSDSVNEIPPCAASHPAHSTQVALDVETMPFSPSGAVVYKLLSSEATGISLSSRLFELSRHAQPDGVYIPVIREDRFYSAPSRLIGVPSSTSSRVAIRVYNPGKDSDTAVRIELFASDGSSLGQAVLPLLYTEPAYGAIYDLATAFPQLRSVDRFDIRVTPLTSGMAYWALVSVTDWDTQQVILITAD